MLVLSSCRRDGEPVDVAVQVHGFAVDASCGGDPFAFGPLVDRVAFKGDAAVGECFADLAGGAGAGLVEAECLESVEFGGEGALFAVAYLAGDPLVVGSGGEHAAAEFAWADLAALFGWVECAVDLLGEALDLGHVHTAVGEAGESGVCGAVEEPAGECGGWRGGGGECVDAVQSLP